MPYPIDKKLVVGVSTTALFDLEEEDRIYREERVVVYKKLQFESKTKPLNKGLAFGVHP